MFEPIMVFVVTVHATITFGLFLEVKEQAGDIRNLRERLKAVDTRGDDTFWKLKELARLLGYRHVKEKRDEWEKKQ